MTATAPHAPAASPSGNRDIVVVGASTGGIETIRRLLARLPVRLPASIFVVVHTAAGRDDALARSLAHESALPVRPASEHERFRPGSVYTAVPDCHLLVGADHVHLSRGPRENSVRPAVDTLFRSAAVTCTSRVVGVLLTGHLDDGTAGSRAIRRCGGVAVVQDPAEAVAPSMPASAIRAGAIDHVRPIAALPELLVELTEMPRPSPVEVPEDLQLESLIAAQRLSDATRIGGQPSLFTCPDCHGALIQIQDGSLVRFRCHTGHAFTPVSLRAAYDEVWERMIYGALRTQHERAALLHRMAAGARQEGTARLAERLEERARSYEEAAGLLRRLAE